MNSLIEMHDTSLIAAFEVGSQIIVVLQAYVHTSEGRPGWDAGSGWIQAAVLTFAEGAVEGVLPELPDDIWKGDLIIDGEVLKNTIPIPLNHSGEIALKLQLNAPGPLIITGKQVVLTLIGEAMYVEEFPRDKD